MTLRAPGIYKAPEDPRYFQIQLGESGIPGFIGLAERGPTNTPVRITSEEEFIRVFGRLEAGGYLLDSVRGFFANGGRYCYVLRVAHMVRRLREETARLSSLKVKDESGRTALTIHAANEGQWGNQIKVSLKRQAPRVSTFLTLDLTEGDTSAVIKSTYGLARGTVIRIYDGEKETYRTITELSGKTIIWEASQPLETSFRSGAPTYIEPVELTVEAHWNGTTERFTNLSMAPNSEQYIERIVNLQSTLLKVEDHRLEGIYPSKLPLTTEEKLLENGSDGLFTITPEDFIGANIGPNERYGLAALEALEEIDLLVAPDLPWVLAHSSGFRTEKDVEIVQQTMISQCERLKTRFAILDFPDASDHRRASQWRLLFDTAYGAFYFPWVQIDTWDGSKRLVPPSGHVAGIYSRCDRTTGVFRAPANEEIHGVVTVARNLFETDIGSLNAEGINCLRSFPHRGIRVWGARTVAHDTQWRYINVRRIVSAVIASVERGLQWAVFESITPILWKSLERQVAGFLRDLWSKGFFQGDTPEEAFYVKCDAENNPAAVRDAGMVVIECGVSPVRPAEFMVFKIDAEVSQSSQKAEP